MTRGSTDPRVWILLPLLLLPATPSGYFWSSSSHAGGVSDAWGVIFSLGYVLNRGKTYAIYVRCVRRGP